MVFFTIDAFVGTAVLFLAMTAVAGPWLKRWGVAGFLFSANPGLPSGSSSVH
jgi:hypothetical protein